MTTSEPPTPATIRFRNIWPYAIIAWFAIFISASVAFVAFAARHPMALVSQNYYEEELLYQQHLESQQRARETGASVSYQEALDRITIQIPSAPSVPFTDGRIDLYRPSNPNLDQSLLLALDTDGAQQLDLSGLLPGVWKVRVRWKQNEQDHFLEHSLIKPGPTS